MWAAVISVLLASADAQTRPPALQALVAVDRRTWLLNFVPFGVGQFRQGRVPEGVFFAASELVLGATSVAAYLAIDALITDRVVFGDRLTPVTVRLIPPERANQANVLTIAKLASGIAFYVLCAAGVIDALIHHDDAVLTPSGLSVRF